jgi:hypothetical protein
MAKDTVLRKIRNGPYRPVSRQVLRWREKMHKAGLRANGKPKEEAKGKLRDYTTDGRTMKNIFTFDED